FGGGIDVVDVYRFEVPALSDVDLRLQTRRDFSLRLLDERGRTVRTTTVGAAQRVRLQPGEYLAAIRTRPPEAGTYAFGVLVREITTTTISTGSAAVTPASVPTLTAQLSTPAAGGGRIRIQIDYFDPLSGWVFQKRFE